MNRSMLAVLIGALMATGTVQAAAQDNTVTVHPDQLTGKK